MPHPIPGFTKFPFPRPLYLPHTANLSPLLCAALVLHRILTTWASQVVARFANKIPTSQGTAAVPGITLGHYS